VSECFALLNWYQVVAICAFMVLPWGLAAILMRASNAQKRLLAQANQEREELRTQCIQSANRQAGLSDLQHDLERFGERIAEFYNDERREVFALRQTVESLSQLHQTMNEQARNLADSLRGSSKARGNWGEFVLERVLESSGLVLGRDYVREGEGLGLRAESGSIRRPDVVVLLPRGRHIVIDAKLSLIGFEEFLASTDADAGAYAQDGTANPGRATAKRFVQAVQAQISDLASKDYMSLGGLDGPDFVFMFVPVEKAFQVFVDNAPDLVEAAWRRGIMLISPATLVPALRLVAQLWGSEMRQKNSMEIAKRAGILCEKLASCLADINEIGEKIHSLAAVQTRVANRWTTGRGNLAWQVEELRRLSGLAGAKPSADESEEFQKDALVAVPPKARSLHTR
jgi:DNA recombination protein RmuC